MNLPRHAFLPLIVTLWAVRAQAAMVVIIGPNSASPDATETQSRIRGELMSLGVEVATADRPSTGGLGASDSDAWVQRIATDRQADAVIDINGGVAPTAVDIWVFERRTGRFELSRVAPDPEGDKVAERIAIRAIEVLRSRLVEIDLATREQRAVTAARDQPPSVTQRDVREPARPAERVGVEAGGAVLTSLDGVGPAVLPIVRVGWTAGSWFMLQASFAGLGSRPTVVTAAGSARIAQQYGVVGGCFCAPTQRGIGLAVAISAGVLRTSLEGQADAPALAHSVERWSFLLDSSLGARLHLPGRYYLTAAAHLQVAEPHVAIHIADTLAATTGYPNLLVSLTLGAWL